MLDGVSFKYLGSLVFGFLFYKALMLISKHAPDVHLRRLEEERTFAACGSEDVYFLCVLSGGLDIRREYECGFLISFG